MKSRHGLPIVLAIVLAVIVCSNAYALRPFTVGGQGLLVKGPLEIKESAATTALNIDTAAKTFKWYTDKFTLTNVGNVGIKGNIAVNTNKFNVTAASGNTAIAGTLGVAGNVAVNTNKFVVTAASGNTAIAGTLGVAGNVAINTNKLTIDATNGNLESAGAVNSKVAIVSTDKALEIVPATHKPGSVIISTHTSGNITLPAVATSAGLAYTLINTGATSFTVTAPAGTLVSDAADNAGNNYTTVVWSTANHIIGVSCTVVCDGTKWYTVSPSTIPTSHTAPGG